MSYKNEKRHEIKFNVTGLTCSGCFDLIRSCIQEKNPENFPFGVRLAEQSDGVTEKGDETDIKISVSAEVTIEIPEGSKHSDEYWLSHFKEQLKTWGFESEPSKSIKVVFLKAVLGLLSGFALMLVTASGFAIPVVTMQLIAVFSTLLTLYLGYDSYRSAYLKLVKAKTLSMDAIFTVSTLFAVGVSIAGLFLSWFPMMFEVPLLIFGFNELGIVIKENIKNSMRKGISFRSRVEKEVDLVEGDESKLVQISKLVPDNIIEVKAGKYIPVNGVLEESSSYICQSIITGDNLPILIEKGDSLYAGMRVPAHINSLRMKVTHTEANSFLADLDKHLDKQPIERAQIEEKTDNKLKYFIRIVFVVAMLCSALVGSLFSFAFAVKCFVSTLASMCPCTYKIIIPLALKVGINKGQQHNVIFKGSRALELAADIANAKQSVIVFDLNGTLTRGRPEVTHICTIPNKISEKVALQYMLALEGKDKDIKTMHPIARAIVKYARKSLTRAEQAEKIEIAFDPIPDRSGVRAYIEGNWFTLGNISILERAGVDVSQAKNLEAKPGEQRIFLARGKEIVCVINVFDPLREDAKSVIEILQQDSKVIICTGADERTAQAYAEMLGIAQENVFAKCIPSKNIHNKIEEGQRTKTEIVEQLKANVFVGDGANDVLAVAAKGCLGIVMHSETSDIGTEDNAQIIISGGSLRPLLAMFAIAKQTLQKIDQSLSLSLTYNLLMTFIAGGAFTAVGFVLHPGVGAFLMLVQALSILYYISTLKDKVLPELQQLDANKLSSTAATGKSLQSNLDFQNEIEKCFNFKKAVVPVATPVPIVPAGPIVTLSDVDVPPEFLSRFDLI